MKLKVVRKWFTEESTIGELFIDNVFFCFTLEDKDRNLKQTDSLLWIKTRKIYGKTAIPTGTYQVKLTNSNRFQRILPEILNVKGYEGVRIHAGNTAEDTLGCILIGKAKAYDKIFESRTAMSELLMRVNLAKELTLEICQDRQL